jgi:O-methyltransferase/methyltransferase family protein
MTAPSPRQLLAELTHGHIPARCLHVVAELGIADALDDRPAAAAELAARCGADAGALERLLRLLSGYGVFAKEARGYAHTPASLLLRSDHPQSLRAHVRMTGMPAMWDAFTALGRAAKTGEPVAGWSDLVEYFKTHPDESALFNEAMVGKSVEASAALVGAYDFAPFRTIADVGGGRGHLLRAVLEAAPNAEGVLFELPHVAVDAGASASPRLRIVAGDFFTDPLPAADLYLLMEVLHDWSDADAARILAALRRAAAPGARVLIVESLMPESPGRHAGHTIDIVMLAVTGGRERTRREHERMLAAAGFGLARVIETATRYSVVEAIAS